MGSVEVGQLINASLRGDDPYCRLDVFFRNRLSLRPNATPPARLPDDFMEPAGVWRLPWNVTVEERTIGDAQNAVSVRIYRDKSCGERTTLGCCGRMAEASPKEASTLRKLMRLVLN